MELNVKMVSNRHFIWNLKKIDKYLTDEIVNVATWSKNDSNDQR